MGEQIDSGGAAPNGASGIHSVFVSYSRKDKERVTGLLGGLTRLGYRVWYDQELSGGQAWWETILAQIRGCDAVLLAVSLAELDSRACQDEFEYARQLGKAVVPVLIEPVPLALLPLELAQLQLVDYTQANQDQVINLLVALRKLPAPAPLPDPLPVPPPVPISYLNQLVQLVDQSTLNLDEQWAIVGKIKEALQDPDLKDSAVNVLRRFNERKDLVRGPAREAEAMLAALEPPPAREPVLAPPIVPPARVIDPAPIVDTEPTGARRTGPAARNLLAIGGLGVGVVIALALAIAQPWNPRSPSNPPATTPTTSTSPTATASPTPPGIPDVYNLPQASAEDLLRKSGFGSRVFIVCSSSVAQGRVRQVILQTSSGAEEILDDRTGVSSAGMSVPAGTTVILKVSTGVPC